MAASNRTPPTLPRSSACDETSMATAVTPVSRIRASRRTRSGASGVVRASATGSPPTCAPTVPIAPVRWPAVRNTASRRCTMVVLPFVPVTPTTVSEPDGSSNTTADIGPIASRTERTRIWGTSRSSHRSTTRATAPPRIASRAWPWPSVFAPTTQKNSAPGTVSRESKPTSRTTTPASPRISAPRTASATADSATWGRGLTAVQRTGGWSRTPEATSRSRADRSTGGPGQGSEANGGRLTGGAAGIASRWITCRAISEKTGAAATPP